PSSFMLSFLAQLEALDLAGGGFRQLGYEVDPTRVFVRRQSALDVLLQRGREFGNFGYIGSQRNECFGFDEPIFVGVTNDGGFEHCGVRREGRFDFKRRNPDAAYFQHVIAPPAVSEISVFTLDIFVATSGPGAEESVAAFVAVVPIISRACGTG